MLVRVEPASEAIANRSQSSPSRKSSASVCTGGELSLELRDASLELLDCGRKRRTVLLRIFVASFIGLAPRGAGGSVVLLGACGLVVSSIQGVGCVVQEGVADAAVADMQNGVHAFVVAPHRGRLCDVRGRVADRSIGDLHSMDVGHGVVDVGSKDSGMHNKRARIEHAHTTG